MALGLSLLLTGCSEKEDFSSFEEVIIEPIEIGLTFRKASLRNQEVAFQVFDEQSNDITQSSLFYVDGSPISGNLFVSES